MCRRHLCNLTPHAASAQCRLTAPQAASSQSRRTALSFPTQGTVLLSTNLANSKADPDGRVYLRSLDGKVRLPDLCITDKNDTFHMGTATFGCFRLMARAVRRSAGSAGLVDGIPTCLSGKFIVSWLSVVQFTLCMHRASVDSVLHLGHLRDSLHGA